MCTLVILRRPDHDWPLLFAANRDEMSDRPWRAPARHWSDRPEVIGGLDERAGGSWLGLNDFGVAAAVLNRPGSLGPDLDKRSRGELVLEALDHADALEAVRALRELDGRAFRSFNLVVADNRDAFWLRSDGTGPVKQHSVPAGVSIITAHDLNSTESRRIRGFLPRFRGAKAPDPAAGEWASWIELLSSREGEPGTHEEGAMLLAREDGYGTLSSSLVALPAWGKPVWMFAEGPPDATPFKPVAI